MRIMVIFWDNKSSDNSKNIFLEIKDKRFKYFTDNNHVSLHSARNKALNFAKENISFLMSMISFSKNYKSKLCKVILKLAFVTAALNSCLKSGK